MKKLTRGIIAVCMLGSVAQASAGDIYLGETGGAFSGRAFLGYKFSDNFSAEVAYVRMVDFTSVIFGDITEVTGPEVSVTGWLPFSDRSSAYARVGSLSWDAEFDGDTIASDTSVELAAGYQYKFGETKKWAFHVEYQHFKDLDHGGALGFSYTF
jgi:hypothetical protein